VTENIISENTLVEKNIKGCNVDERRFVRESMCKFEITNTILI